MNYTDHVFGSNYYPLQESSSCTTSPSTSSETTNIESFDDVSVIHIIRQTAIRFGSHRFLSMLYSESVDMIDWNAMRRELKIEIDFVCRQKQELNLIVKNEDRLEVDDVDLFLSYSWNNRYYAEEHIKGKTQIALDFDEISSKIGQIIILESNLPQYMKTIQPSSSMGGIAGGEKYVRNGILFKFARDVSIASGQWLFGKSIQNDEYAAKSLSSEIKALKAFYYFLLEHPEIENVRYPLMNKITFLGITICAVTMIPIGNQSLVYGSDNAGKDYGKSNGELNDIIDKIALYFNFAKHTVLDNNNKKLDISLAADVEVHQIENTYYFLDFGRFLPSNSSQHPFLSFFREEFICDVDIMEGRLISCDSFTGFGRLDSDEHNKNSLEIIELLNQRLELQFWDEMIIDREVIITPYNIKLFFHQHGINLRFMGRLRMLALEKFYDTKLVEYLIVASYLLREMILRSLKSITNRTTKQIYQTGILSSYFHMRKYLFDFYNKIKQIDKWCYPELKAEILSKYGDHALLGTEKEESMSLFYSISNDSPFLEYYYFLFPLMNGEDYSIPFCWNDADLSKVNGKVEYLDSDFIQAQEEYLQYYEFNFETFLVQFQKYCHFQIGHSILDVTLFVYSKSLSTYIFESIVEGDLFWSIDCEDLPLLKVQLEHKPEFIKSGLLPYACQQEKSVEMIEFLLVSGADINELDFDKKSSIFYMLFNSISNPEKYFPVVEELFKYHPNLETEYTKTTPFSHHQKLPDMIKVFHLLVIINNERFWKLFSDYYATQFVDVDYLETAFGYYEEILVDKKLPIAVSGKFLTDLIQASSGELFYNTTATQICKNGTLKDLKNYLACFGTIPPALKRKIFLTACFECNSEIAVEYFDLNESYPKLFLIDIMKRTNDLSIIKTLVDLGFNPHKSDTYQDTLLHIACRNNNLEITQFLIQIPVEINPLDQEGRTPLFFAAQLGHVDIIKYLLEHGADDRIANSIGISPLTISISVTVGTKNINLDQKRLETIRSLITNGDINRKNQSGDALLHLAIWNGCAEVVWILLEASADIQIKDNLGRTPMYYVSACEDIKILEYMVGAGADINSVYGGEDDSLLMKTCLNQNFNVAKKMVTFGADVNYKNKSGSNVLMVLCEMESIQSEILEMAVYLINSGIDLNEKDLNGNTALLLTAYCNMPSLMKVLLDAGVDINLHNDKGGTPLSIASALGYTDIVKLLIENRAEVNCQDEIGRTPLMEVVLAGKSELVKYLLESGSDPNIRDVDGVSCLLVAREMNYTEIVDYLLQHNAEELPPEDLEKIVRRPLFCSNIQIHFLQPFYSCETCNLVGTLGVCATCLNVCHKGHKIVKARYCLAYCDCKDHCLCKE